MGLTNLFQMNYKDGNVSFLLMILIFLNFNKEEYDSFYQGDGGRSDRGYNESSYLYIPVDRLMKIQNERGFF